MAETGPGKDDLRWHRQCIRTVGGITSGWALVHIPPLAARLVHALVKLLAVGSAPRSEPEPKVSKPWGFWTAPWDNNGGNQRRDRRSRGESLGGTAPNRRRTRGESMGGGDDRRSSSGSGGGRGGGGGDRDGWKHRREVEERRMEELQTAALQA